MLLSRDFALQPRDRAVISATLAVGSVTQTVTVAAQSAVLVTAENSPAASGSPLRQASGGLALPASAPVDRPRQAGRRFEWPQLTQRITAGERADAAPHVRSYFPEALYINPEIITDGNGDANISIPIADSITTWRMAMLASTRSGALGSATSSLKVFPDFFVDLDLPVTLTQGDRVSIPVAVYNYSGRAGKVSLKLQPDEWFSLDNDSSEKTVAVESGRVGSSQFTLNANRIGKFKLTLTAHMDGAAGGENRNDIVVREIEVVPNGREQSLVFNGRLENSCTARSSLPR